MFYIIWIGVSLVVGLIGKEKSLGFLGYFLISLFLSPLIGFIVYLFSSENNKKIPEYLISFKKAKMSENRGDINEAIKLYKDVIFLIDELPNNGDSPILRSRLEKRKFSANKIFELEKVSI
ncbi:hypothetical protein ULMS_06270 [Patiriisocius marinistellae]|uniref:Uncharacterized protein n=1 Tax=Patiriisocius marinistellae TaxID=2494560 RepID=A0A5J4FY94_9FLAO|nr:hypothetical protein [Patiriisocius marinistellae]GEQ85119.1 hypothetical protein ULMS_06270 [Patiriisocius marinistellae]